MTLQQKDLKNIGDEIWIHFQKGRDQIKLQAMSKVKNQVMNQCDNEVQYAVNWQVHNQVYFDIESKIVKL